MSRGCNLKCFFCPVYATPELQDPAQRRFMSPELMAVVARQCNELNPEARVELTMRGEPTLNPDIIENIAIMRTFMPRAQLTMFTNGIRFLTDAPDLPMRLLDAGLNILCVDCYGNTYPKFEKIARDIVGKTRGDVQLRDFRSFSAYKHHAYGHTLRVINLVPDIGAEAEGKPLVAVRVLHNNAGNASATQLQTRYGIQPLGAPLAKRCARPFRELVVTWDGQVVICCHDWKTQAVMGTIPDQSASDIWYGAMHHAILKNLYDKDRSGEPCNRCDYKGGFRTGLLKNPHCST